MILNCLSDTLSMLHSSPLKVCLVISRLSFPWSILERFITPNWANTYPRCFHFRSVSFAASYSPTCLCICLLVHIPYKGGHLVLLFRDWLLWHSIFKALYCCWRLTSFSFVWKSLLALVVTGLFSRACDGLAHNFGLHLLSTNHFLSLISWAAYPPSVYHSWRTVC